MKLNLLKRNHLIQQEKYKNLFLKRLREKHPEIKNEDELYKIAMDEYDDDHEFAKRTMEENDQFEKLCQKSIDFAILYASYIERIDEELPELALLDIQQPLKDLIAGRIDVDEYKKRKQAIITN